MAMGHSPFQMLKGFMAALSMVKLTEQGKNIIKSNRTYYRQNGEIIPGQWKNNVFVDKNYGRK